MRHQFITFGRYKPVVQELGVIQICNLNAIKQVTLYLLTDWTPAISRANTRFLTQLDYDWPIHIRVKVRELCASCCDQADHC